MMAGVFHIVSISFAQTQYGEGGLFYTPSAYAILPGIFEFGIFGNNQFSQNRIEFPSPIYFAMGLAPRIESFASFPDILSLAKNDNIFQQYGNVGLKVRLIRKKKRYVRFAVSTYLRYLANGNIHTSYRYLPGCILHASWIDSKGRIFHIGLDGYQEASPKLNVKFNFGVEAFFIEKVLNVYFDSYLSPFNKKQWKNEWMGIISMVQWCPHQVVSLETGIGVEMSGKKPLPFVHLGFSFTSGIRIKSILRKKKDDLPKPPPLEDMLNVTQKDQPNKNGSGAPPELKKDHK